MTVGQCFADAITSVCTVSADQIVRTDLKELVDLNLDGRVYGYAPMGDDREDMEGFRFWKTGKKPRLHFVSSHVTLISTHVQVIGEIV